MVSVDDCIKVKLKLEVEEKTERMFQAIKLIELGRNYSAKDLLQKTIEEWK